MNLFSKYFPKKAVVATPSPASVPSTLASTVDLGDALEFLDAGVSVVSYLNNRHQKTVSGDYKRSEAMRVLLNRFPTANKNDLGIALELAVKKCSTQPPSGR